ncbi:hypothetical protein SERLA73DRAFT_77642 [Serpula lacrymans var. lacrymans S7.3]|uniref:Uncharacterized protein n=2 Tax=Serpula lacrymans var. lacrymans TaxID=341189 RepID=F8QA03_SERL3|nr:uncharacterized protein SERLADRAFT_442541 [Serpula lacrymans var. lacrymans S7.9]EGN94908.1 hypothetical protein SERLA73DRAFT_77642 [Serpula lacrymans var. lacrymans S7.3]EGO20406.1 hypothetical protein SERLADRAFT_442541 [Serpula lacrymans var. lacrymans S7.9]
MLPRFKDQISNATLTEDEIEVYSELVQKGCSGAQSDDTKTLKGAVIDWITPNGQSIDRPLHCNIKTTQGFNHPRTDQLLCPAGLDWDNTE